MRKHGLAFAAGVVVSFWLLAAVLVALRAAGAQLGWASSCSRQWSSPVLRCCSSSSLNMSGLFEIRLLLPRRSPAGTRRIRTSTMPCPACSPSSSRRLLGAVHGRRTRLRADELDRVDVDRLYDTRCRHGAALSRARVFPRMALKAAETGGVDAPPEAAARISAVRDGDLAGLGVGGAARQRRSRTTRRDLVDGRAGTLGLADDAHRRRARLGCCGDRKPCGRIDRRLAGGRRCCKRGREAGGRRVRAVAGLHAAARCAARRRGPAGVRRFHRRLVRYLPGQQASGPEHRCRASGVRARQRRAGARRLDAPRCGDWRRVAAGTRRRAGLRPVPPDKRRCCCRSS